MLVYLDMCSIHRPLDDKSQIRILVESQAVLGIIALCESGQVHLVSSDALLGDWNMTVNVKPLAEVTQRAIEILCRELGAADTMRFINQFTNGHGDYTAEREAIFGGETLDQIIADIKQAKPGAQGSSDGIEVNSHVRSLFRRKGVFWQLEARTFLSIAARG